MKFIDSYTYKDHVFSIYYSSKDGLYTAKSGSMSTYDTDLEGLKSRIKTVVYQHTEFKLGTNM